MSQNNKKNINIKNLYIFFYDIKDKILSKKIIKTALPISLFLLSMIIYIFLMYPGVGGRVNYGDSAKWQYLHLVNGTPHGPGYPLFMLICKFFYFTLPFLSPAIRITMISVVFGAMNIVNTYYISFYLTEKKSGAFIAAIIMAFSYTYMSQTTEAEVYTLNAFFVTSVILFFLKYHNTKKKAFLLTGSFIYAISFGNHLTMITLLPALIYIVFITDKKVFINYKIILLIIGFIIIGASLYMYTFITAHINPNEEYLEFLGKNPSLKLFFQYLTGGEFKGNLFVFSLWEIISYRIPLFFKMLREELSFILLFSLIGLILFLIINKKRRQDVVFLLIIGLCQFIYALNYNIWDIWIYLIPVYNIIIIFTAMLFYINADIIIHRLLLWLVKAFLSLAVFYLLYFNITALHFNTKNYRLKRFTDLLSYIPKKSSLLVGDIEYHNEQLFHYMNITKEYGDYYITNNYEKVKNQKRFYFMPANYEKINNEGEYIITEYTKLDSLKETLNKNKIYFIFLSAKGEAKEGLSNETLKYMKDYLKSNIINLKSGGSYLGYIWCGQFRFEKINNNGDISLNIEEIKKIIPKSFHKYFFIKRMDSKLYSGGTNYGNKSSIFFNDVEFSINKRGINLAIFSDKGIELHHYDTHITDEKIIYRALKN